MEQRDRRRTRKRNMEEEIEGRKVREDNRQTVDLGLYPPWPEDLRNVD
jgi:hypothetical protein